MGFEVIDGGRVRALIDEHQRQLDTVVPLVVVCGPKRCADGNCGVCDVELKSRCMYIQRDQIKRRLNEENCIATTFEEDFELDIASIEERIVLRREEVDLVFIIPDSEGSAAELGIFSLDPRIRPKLRILVPHQYHPLYSEGDSFLSSLYLELMSVHGHIYPVDPLQEIHPDGMTVASAMMRSYRLNVVACLLRG